MATISNLLRGLVGLFIDDGSLAVALLIILIVVGIARHAGLVSGTIAAVFLCVGLAIALLENVLRSTQVLKRKILNTKD
jgi:DMSO/TMAO reductase YedYZ heme-binding membrane subunit